VKWWAQFIEVNECTASFVYKREGAAKLSPGAHGQSTACDLLSTSMDDTGPGFAQMDVTYDSTYF
jgi:hypothetical protein